MVDIVIRNGRVVTPAGVVYGGVAISDGVIAGIFSDKDLPSARRTLNAHENFVIPGLIDPHVHMGSEEDPSLEAGIELNFPVETEGAVHGGVTTFGHFVGVKGQPLAPYVDTTIRQGQEHACVDFFLHAFIMEENHLSEQRDLCRRGVTSFKHMFNAYKPREDDDRMGWLSGPVNEGVLFRSLEFTVRQGYPCLGMVHCEEIDICLVLEERLRSAGRKDLAAWTEAHPNYAEYIRILHALEIAKAAEAPLYVVHVSTAEGADLLAAARRQGYRVWGETAPHYLTHTADMEGDIGCWGKVNPSLKYSRDRERLWRGILDGSITCLGTDHGTGGRTKQKKQAGLGKHGNIWDSRVGIRGGMEHMLPVMMTLGVSAGRIDIEDLVRVGSTNTAKAFGLYPRKGAIIPGADADLAIVDPEKESVIDTNFYHGLCEVSIYEGWKVKGMARTTLVRGKLMMEDYETIGKPGHGRFTPCRAY